MYIQRDHIQSVTARTKKSGGGVRFANKSFYWIGSSEWFDRTDPQSICISQTNPRIALDWNESDCSKLESSRLLLERWHYLTTRGATVISTVGVFTCTNVRQYEWIQSIVLLNTNPKHCNPVRMCITWFSHKTYLAACKCEDKMIRMISCQ